MTILFQSILMSAAVIIAVCAIVFPIIFLVQFHGFRKDFRRAFLQDNAQEANDEQQN